MMSRVNKSCDQCRIRKVRCIIPEQTADAPGVEPRCIHCIKRDEACHFSVYKRKIRRHPSQELKKEPSDSEAWAFTPAHPRADLFIDRLLQSPASEVRLSDEYRILTTDDERIQSSSLAFFSEKRVASITKRIGTNRLKDLVERLDHVLLQSIAVKGDSRRRQIHFKKPANTEVAAQLPPGKAQAYLDKYWENIHPLYPFLDRAAFDQKASDPNLLRALSSDPLFSALYHALLALGSQFVEGGSFEPCKGIEWGLFQVSLGYLPEIMAPRGSLANLQALIAMSIFAMNASSLQIDDALMSETARLAQCIRVQKSSDPYSRNVASQKAFWVVYYMEKHIAFQSRISSIIADCDIGCSIPLVPEAIIDNYNWFLSSIRIGRIMSIAYDSLFSVSASLNSPEAGLAGIADIRDMLEKWKSSIPPEFRPGEATHPANTSNYVYKTAFLHTHFSYYLIIIGLERLTLHLDQTQNESTEFSKHNLMKTARACIELSRFVDIEPYTPVFILGVMPLAATFILFDFVIHNPTHPETRSNLTLLQADSGYLSMIDYKTNALLPGSLVAEFAHIAEEYVQQVSKDEASGATAASKSAAAADMSDVDRASMGVSLLDVSSDDWQAGAFDHDISLEPEFDANFLYYPTPDNFMVPTDMQVDQRPDVRNLLGYGWVFPEW